MNADIKANTEVLWHEWALSIALQHHLAIEESSLRHARVDLLWLNHEDGLVLEEVVNEQ